MWHEQVPCKILLDPEAALPELVGMGTIRQNTLTDGTRVLLVADDV
jgi:hypothetical protein